MISAPLILVMAALARMAGGGLWAEKLNKRGEIDEATGKDKGGVMRFNLSMLPEVLFGVAFGLANWMLLDSVLFAAACAVWSYQFMETGHVFNWGQPVKRPRGGQTLTPVVDFLARIFKIEKFIEDGFSPSKNYCRLFMAVKGFLIGLPVGGIPLAILWPLAYEIGDRFDSHPLKELLSGAFAGLLLTIIINL